MTFFGADAAICMTSSCAKVWNGVERTEADHDERIAAFGFFAGAAGAPPASGSP